MGKIPPAFPSKALALLKCSKSSTDLNFHNFLLQSYASISTTDDSSALLRHMMKTNASFSPDKSTHHILLTQYCKSHDSNLAPVHQGFKL
ncbi:hypothetical protein L6164_027521 [Bauhinia variegata]|uniref:Uncharacterized protein n=1 Tax=Bauhinia variegata TaxID=167791 RepID=A0ACB9LV21_BAUVA|nr:hypothetical protein L6164_027521 [Bauhinia variegata]